MTAINRRSFLATSALTGAGLLAANPFAAADDPIFRLGIVGSDNSHSLAFSKLCNTGQEVEGEMITGVRVTHICGADAEITKGRADGGEIPNIVAGPEDMVGQVDGVLCVRRHGGAHLADAAPFLKARIPVFVDKPLTCDVEEARELIALADKARVGFTSFSTLRYARKTVTFNEGVKEKAGDLVAGTVTGPCELDSEYGGVFFYGIHCVELMHATFGYGVKTVQARVHGTSASVACTYENGPVVTLQLIHGAQYGFHIATHGAKAYDYYTVDSHTAYFDGMQVILETLQTGTWPLTAEELLAPVQVLAAIQRSLQTGNVEEVV